MKSELYRSACYIINCNYMLAIVTCGGLSEIKEESIERKEDPCHTYSGLLSFAQ